QPGAAPRPGALGTYLKRNYDAIPERRPGTRVFFVYPASPAEAAGLRPDDVILKVGEISYEDSFVIVDGGSPDLVAGQTVDVIFRRGAQLLQTRATIGPQPSIEEDLRLVTALAERGNARAQQCLAEILCEDPNANCSRAIPWSLKAAEQNQTDAQAWLA